MDPNKHLLKKKGQAIMGKQIKCLRNLQYKYLLLY